MLAEGRYEGTAYSRGFDADSSSVKGDTFTHEDNWLIFLGRTIVVTVTLEHTAHIGIQSTSNTDISKNLAGSSVPRETERKRFYSTSQQTFLNEIYVTPLTMPFSFAHSSEILRKLCPFT